MVHKLGFTENLALKPYFLFLSKIKITGSKTIVLCCYSIRIGQPRLLSTMDSYLLNSSIVCHGGHINRISESMGASDLLILNDSGAGN